SHESCSNPRLRAPKITEPLQKARENTVLRCGHTWPLNIERAVGLDKRINHQASFLDTLLPSPHRHVVAGVAGGRARQSIGWLACRKSLNEMSHLVGNLLPAELGVARGEQSPNDAPGARRPFNEPFVYVMPPRRRMIASVGEVEEQTDHRQLHSARERDFGYSHLHGIGRVGLPNYGQLCNKSGQFTGPLAILAFFTDECLAVGQREFSYILADDISPILQL